MRFKKGFTLAEILIVLTIIGVMAVMTIPSLIQNSNSQQKIVQFKKGYNAISNAYATEFTLKSPPKNGSADEMKKMWLALSNQLNVKYYQFIRNSNIKAYTPDIIDSWSANSTIMVTEDGIGYKIGRYTPEDTICKTRLETNSYKSSSELMEENSCMVIGIIIDKKFLGGSAENAEEKNCFREQWGGDMQDLSKIKCNTLWIPVTKDGITAGNPDCTISGRIMSDNITYDATKCTAQ